jgi:hypothetical protein
LHKLYTSELDLPEERLYDFVRWYAFRHAPDIYQIGFHTCTSYRGIAGDMKVLDLYEIDSVDIFDTPQYRTIGTSDPYFTDILSHRTDKAHGIHTQVHIVPPPVDGRALLNADWLQVERFDCAGAEQQDLIDYLEREGEAERILLAGAKRVRLSHRTKAGPKHASNRPRWLLLAEWPQQPSIDDIGRRLQTRFAGAISNPSCFVGYRLYPWPDRPEVVPRHSTSR